MPLSTKFPDIWTPGSGGEFTHLDFQPVDGKVPPPRLWDVHPPAPIDLERYLENYSSEYGRELKSTIGGAEGTNRFNGDSGRAPSPLVRQATDEEPPANFEVEMRHHAVQLGAANQTELEAVLPMVIGGASDKEVKGHLRELREGKLLPPRPRPQSSLKPDQFAALAAPKTVVSAKKRSGISVVAEIDEIRRKMRQERRAYFADEALQARYRELIAFQQQNRA